MALTTILLDNDGTLVDTYNMILESFKHATQEVLGKQFSEAEGWPASRDANARLRAQC